MPWAGPAQSSSLTTFLAVWGAVVSTTAILWNIIRDVRKRAKLSVKCYVGKIVTAVPTFNQGPRLVWNVTNTGGEAVVLTHIGGSQGGDMRFMIDTKDLPKTLEPGQYYLGYSNNLDLLGEPLEDLWAIDSLNRHWKISKKAVRKLVSEHSK